MKIDVTTIDHFRIDRTGRVYLGLRQLAQSAELPLKSVFGWWEDHFGWGQPDATGVTVLESQEFMSALLLLELREQRTPEDYLHALGAKLQGSTVFESNPVFWMSEEDGAELIGYTEFTRRIHRVKKAFVFDFEEIAHQLYEVVKQHIATRKLNLPEPIRPRTTKLSSPISA